MTTDLVKYRELERVRAAAGVSLFRELLGVSPQEARKAKGFNLNADHNVEVQKLLALLEQQSLEKEGHERCMSATCP